MNLFKKDRSHVTDIDLTARHEACHAVALLAYNLPCDSVDVITDNHVGGTTRWRVVNDIFKKHTPTEAADQSLEYLVAIMAPYVGMKDLDPDLETSCSQDQFDADEFIEIIIRNGTAPTGYQGEMTREGLRDYACTTAKELLDKLTQHVDFLAECLIDSKGEYALKREVLNPLYGRIYPDLHGRG